MRHFRPPAVLCATSVLSAVANRKASAKCRALHLGGRGIALQNNEIAAFCSVVVFLKSLKYLDRFGSDRMGTLFTYAQRQTCNLPCAVPCALSHDCAHCSRSLLGRLSGYPVLRCGHLQPLVCNRRIA